MDHKWRFPLRSCRVYDADTLMEMQLDLGFGVSIVATGRLEGINAPEVRGAEKERGIVAREWLKARIDIANDVIVETLPSDERPQGKYGRWLITVWADGENLNDLLVSEGFAVQASYR
jgi:micrococcal nuclease